MIIERVNNWFNLSKQYFFTYKDGFFNLSVLANSPEIILQSASKMPFVKHDENLQKVSADSMFLNNSIQYAKLEDGLWIMNSVSEYKNNLSFTAIYDKFIPANYYYLSLNLVYNNVQESELQVNNVKIENQSLVFCKPKIHTRDYHFKNSKEEFYTLYFSEDWLKQNLLNSPNLSKEVKTVFETKGLGDYLVFKNLNYKLTDKLSDAFSKSTLPDTFALKKMIFEFFELFFNKVNDTNFNISYSIKEKDKARVLKIEHYLLNNLHNKFPGIDFLANKFDSSPTKIKKDFSTYFNMPLYKFFQLKQMELAKEYLLENNNYSIKEIAQMFNYDSPSKFSKAFYKCNGVLPSSLKRND